MEIPQEFKDFLCLDKVEKRLDLFSGLIAPEKKGKILSLAALAEEEIAGFLSNYLARPERFQDFENLIADSLTFHQKIEALKKILPKVDDDKTHYDSHIEFLRALKKLRNAAAHSYGIDIEEAKVLADDLEIIFLLTDLPRNIWSRVTALKNYLATLKQ
jgi:hypothetical protein